MKDIGFSKEAKLEFNVNEGGVAIVGNKEGYEALARFCNEMAEVHSDIRKNDPDFEDAEWHLGDEISKEAIKEGRYIFSPGPVTEMGWEGSVPDVLFYVRDKIGKDFWGEEVESGAHEDWINQYT